MLSREVMGLFCLGVVWVTALLVAGAAWQELRDLRALARRAKRAIVGTVEGDDLAEWSVEQTGRALDVAGDDAIAFHDRTFRSRILGGRVRVGDDLVEVPAGDGEVWIDERARAEAADCAGAQELDTAYAQARKAKGFHREVRVRVRAGERVWVFGDVVSTIDPLAFCRRKSVGFALFIPFELVACAAATRLAMSTPHFGHASIAGAVACLAFFLGVTPLGVALREGARRPHVAFLRTRWSLRASRRALASATAEAAPQKN